MRGCRGRRGPHARLQGIVLLLTDGAVGVQDLQQVKQRIG